MTRQIVFTPHAPKPPATYSQAVKAAGLVFVSGTAPTDSATGQFKGDTIQEQTRQCLTNIAAILAEAGSSMEKIVSATVIMADEEDFKGMNEEWVRWFPHQSPGAPGRQAPGARPRHEDLDRGDRRGLAREDSSTHVTDHVTRWWNGKCSRGR